MQNTSIDRLMALMLALTLAMPLSGIFVSAAYAQQAPNTPATAGSNNTLGTTRTDPNTPKPYNPNNPGPDTRTAPTDTSSGKGANSGGHPEANGK